MGKSNKSGVRALKGMQLEGDELMTEDAIRAALDFKQDRIMTYTVKASDIPDGWGLAPGFGNSPSAVGGTNARWQVLVPYLLENYPDDFMLINSGGIGVQDDGSAIMASPGSQYLAVRTVYPFDHSCAGEATDGLLITHMWSKEGVKGPLKEQLDKAQAEYNVHHFQELVKIRALRDLGNLEGGRRKMLIDDLPEDWNEQMCNAILHMPPIVWNDHNGFVDIYVNTGKGRKANLGGFTHSSPGHKVDKPVDKWNFNDDNDFVTTARLQAAAAWCGFLKDCDPAQVVLPNLVDKDVPLGATKDDQGKIVPAEGRRQTPLNVPRDRAEKVLTERGLRVEFKGQGEYVVGQDPMVLGEMDAIQPGSTVTLTLGDKADWKREYVDSIPSQEDRHRRETGGFISIEQQRKVIKRAFYTSGGIETIAKHVADSLGVEPPKSDRPYAYENWVREQLESFPEEKLSQLNKAISKANAQGHKAPAPASDEEVRRRQSLGVISDKQQRLVFARLRNAEGGLAGVAKQVAEIGGVELPEGDESSLRTWLDQQLANFPKDRFDQLLKAISN